MFDSKRDALRTIAGIKPSCSVHNLDPFAEGCEAWEIAEDIDDPALAYEAASILVPEEKGGENSSFFVNAARDLCAGVMQAFIIKKPKKWTLAELILTLSDKDKAEKLLRSVPQTRHIADEHFNRDERALNNVLYTLTAALAPLRPIAALYANSKKK